MQTVGAWFRDGADAFSKLVPGHQWGYVCPLCLRLFGPDQEEKLTREHAPPEKLGGRVVALTCCDCNNSAGYSLDSHAIGFDTTVTLLEGGDPGRLRARFPVQGEVLNAVGNQTAPGYWEFRIDPRVNSPDAMDALSLLGDVSSIQVVRPAKSDGQRASVSWLRAAYLVAFACFGYSYILNRVMEPIREQIRQPDLDVIHHYLHLMPPTNRSWRFIGYVEKPTWLRSVVVEMGRYAVFLPDLTRTAADLYETISNHTSEHGLAIDEDMEGLEYEWPIKPTYALDHS